MEESYIRNCIFAWANDCDTELFGLKEVDDKVVATFVRLDGYAIIPVDKYHALLSMKSEPTLPPEPSASV